MTKKYIFVAGMALGVLLVGAAAQADNSTSTPTSTPVSEMPKVFTREVGVIRSVNAAQVVLEVRNDCNGAPGGAICAAWYSKEVTVDLAAVLLTNQNDEVMYSYSERILAGRKAMVFYKSGVPYALKVFGVGQTEQKPKDIKTGSSTPDGRKICVKVMFLNGEGRSEEKMECRKLMPGITQGKRGEEVMHLQKLLQEKGLLPGDAATGFFGQMTLKAVKELQLMKGLPSTGFVGPMTIEKLEAESENEND